MSVNIDETDHEGVFNITTSLGSNLDRHPDTVLLHHQYSFLQDPVF